MLPIFFQFLNYLLTTSTMCHSDNQTAVSSHLPVSPAISISKKHFGFFTASIFILTESNQWALPCLFFSSGCVVAMIDEWEVKFLVESRFQYFTTNTKQHNNIMIVLGGKVYAYLSLLVHIRRITTRQTVNECWSSIFFLSPYLINTCNWLHGCAQ